MYSHRIFVLGDGLLGSTVAMVLYVTDLLVCLQFDVSGYLPVAVLQVAPVECRQARHSVCTQHGLTNTSLRTILSPRYNEPTLATLCCCSRVLVGICSSSSSSSSSSGGSSSSRCCCCCCSSIHISCRTYELLSLATSFCCSRVV